MNRNQKGFSPVEVLLIIVVLGLVGGVGWYVWSQKDTDKKSNSENSITTKASDVTNFYDCFDKVGQFNPGKPQTCIYQDQTFNRPSEFTNEDVRNLEKVPTSAKQTVLTLAKKNFDACKDEPSIISVTTIINTVDDSFVYLGTGCDSGYRAIYFNQNGTWTEISHSQGGLSCEVADKYKIPKELVQVNGEESTATCYASDGKSRALQY